jgi:hypothetical protein
LVSRFAGRSLVSLIFEGNSIVTIKTGKLGWSRTIVRRPTGTSIWMMHLKTDVLETPIDTSLNLQFSDFGSFILREEFEEDLPEQIVSPRLETKGRAPSPTAHILSETEEPFVSPQLRKRSKDLGIMNIGSDLNLSTTSDVATPAPLRKQSSTDSPSRHSQELFESQEISLEAERAFPPIIISIPDSSAPTVSCC